MILVRVSPINPLRTKLTLQAKGKAINLEVEEEEFEEILVEEEDEEMEVEGGGRRRRGGDDAVFGVAFAWTFFCGGFVGEADEEFVDDVDEKIEFE